MAIVDKAIEDYTRPLADSLDGRAREALQYIRPVSRRLLALRYYHVRESEIDSLWTWSRAQVRIFRQSAEYDSIVGAIASICDSFAQQNPGHALRVRLEARTLSRQIANWNTVRSVRLAADSLRQYCRGLFLASMLPLYPDSASQVRFDSLFLSAPDPVEPTVALPGLSQHGQLRAFDFKIVTRSGRLVAGAASSAISPVWEAKGWTARLRRAVDSAAPTSFVGPLSRPYEPWHYSWIGHSTGMPLVTPSEHPEYRSR